MSALNTEHGVYEIWIEQYEVFTDSFPAFVVTIDSFGLVVSNIVEDAEEDLPENWIGSEVPDNTVERLHLVSVFVP